MICVRGLVWIGLWFSILFAGCQGSGEHTKRGSSKISKSDFNESPEAKSKPGDGPEVDVRDVSDSATNSSQPIHLRRATVERPGQNASQTSHSIQGTVVRGARSHGSGEPIGYEETDNTQELVAEAKRSDADADEASDADDNCIAVYNPDQEDGDEDGIGDACDECPAAPGPRTMTGCPGDISPCDDVQCDEGEMCRDGVCEIRPVSPNPPTSKSSLFGVGPAAK